MQRISGTLDAFGPSISQIGGMRYSYITLTQGDGRVVNIPDIVAFTNVQSALIRILGRDEEDRRVTIHSKGNLFIYALEEENGPIHSDIAAIRTTWLASIAAAFGPLLLAALLFTSDNKQIGLFGLILGLFGFMTLAKFWNGVFIFWPGFGANALHQRSLRPVPFNPGTPEPEPGAAQG